MHGLHRLSVSRHSMDGSNDSFDSDSEYSPSDKVFHFTFHLLCISMCMNRHLGKSQLFRCSWLYKNWGTPMALQSHLLFVQ